MRAHLRSGFTIVELLIVVVVVAILAAIVIIAYNGIRQRAVESSVQSSVQQAATKIESYFVTSGDVYPSDLDTVDIADANDTTYAYSVDNSASPRTFCISATSGATSYYLTNSQKTLTSGSCDEPADLMVFGPSSYPYTATLYNDGTNVKVATLFHSNTSSFKVKGARVYMPSAPAGVSLTVFYVVGWHNGALINRPTWTDIPSGIPGQYTTITAGSLASGWNSVTFPTQPTINPFSAGVDGTCVWIGYYFSDGTHYIHAPSPTSSAIQGIGGSDLYIGSADFEGAKRSAYTESGSPGATEALYGIDITTTEP
jgi:prepilin-type N-terminal cleavage/methylation domain-containing protein